MSEFASIDFGTISTTLQSQLGGDRTIKATQGAMKANLIEPVELDNQTIKLPGNQRTSLHWQASGESSPSSLVLSGQGVQVRGEGNELVALAGKNLREWVIASGIDAADPQLLFYLREGITSAIHQALKDKGYAQEVLSPQQVLGPLPLLDPSTIDFNTGAVVTNNALRYYLPVPKIIGKSGLPQMIQFFNGEDRTMQMALTDGKEGIVINGVTVQEAQLINQRIISYNKPITELTMEDFRDLLGYVRNGLGIQDFYHKSRKSAGSDVSRIAVENDNVDLIDCRREENLLLGLAQVQGREAQRAVLVQEPFMLTTGPVHQYYPNGGIILQSPDGNEHYGISIDAFIRTYHVNGTTISSRADLDRIFGLSF